MKVRVLYVDHEKNNVKSFAATFRKEVSVLTACSIEEAEKVLRENNVDVVFADYQMPEKTGLEFLKQVFIEYPDITRILLTGSFYNEYFHEAKQKGYFHRFMNKPWDIDELRNEFDRSRK